MTELAAKTQSQKSGSQTSLDAILTRCALILDSLAQDCLDLQEIQALNSQLSSNEQIIKAQALDRVTQSLQSLSTFNTALAALPNAQDIAVGESEIATVKLDALRTILSAGPQVQPPASTDVDLFLD